MSFLITDCYLSRRCITVIIIFLINIKYINVVEFGTETVDEGANPSAPPSPGVATTGGGVLPAATGAVWLMLLWLFDMML